jgi:hypothetical protein
VIKKKLKGNGAMYNTHPTYREKGSETGIFVVIEINYRLPSKTIFSC